MYVCISIKMAIGQCAQSESASCVISYKRDDDDGDDDDEV